jgi:hypothetical protein
LREDGFLHDGIAFEKLLGISHRFGNALRILFRHGQAHQYGWQGLAGRLRGQGYGDTLELND